MDRSSSKAQWASSSAATGSAGLFFGLERGWDFFRVLAVVREGVVQGKATVRALSVIVGDRRVTPDSDPDSGPSSSAP